MKSRQCRITSDCYSGMSLVKVYIVELGHPPSLAVNTITLPNPSPKYHVTYVLDQGLANYNPLWAFICPMS